MPLARRAVTLARTLALTAFATLALARLTPRAAQAENVIKRPGAHPDYRVELEPHATFGFWKSPFGKPKGEKGVGAEIGGGFRATIEVADPAFIPRLNNTVGITFGGDFTGCVAKGCGDAFRARLPVGLQWNFWITPEFSAFADLGFMLRIGGSGVYPDFFTMGGVRYLFADRIAFTARIGYPFVTAGISIFR